MKILLSAYACEPNKGSEPAVGWNWARTLVGQGHSVHVITRSNNRTAIEPAIEREQLPLAVSYYDLPAWCRRWKRFPGGIFWMPATGRDVFAWQHQFADLAHRHLQCPPDDVDTDPLVVVLGGQPASALAA